MKHRHHHVRSHRRHHGHPRVFLVISGYYYELNPYWRLEIMTQLTVGHVDTLTYVIVDANGNPMIPQPALDSPAVWTDAPSAAGVETFAAAADGTSAVVTATAAGSDTVGLTVIVGGKTFTASDLITVSAAPQVASGVQIVDTVV